MGITIDRADGTAVVTVSNPGRRNALDATLSRELTSACDRLDDDPAVGVVVIRGDDGYFCSGGDRDELAAVCAEPTSDWSLGTTDAIYQAFVRFGQLRMPTIAAIRGGALGAGMNLALAADVRVAGHDAVLASGFLRLGVHPGGGHFSLLGRAAGAGAAAVMGLLGATVDGRRAREIGLVWDSVPDAEVEQYARALGRHAASDPDLARAAKTSWAHQCRGPAMAWPAAVQLERSPQLWSFARKGQDAWTQPEAPARG